MADESSRSKFPSADIDGELNPGSKTNFEVDPASSLIAEGHTEVVFPKNSKKKSCCEKEYNCRCTNEGLMNTLKKSLMVSGVIVALAASAFVVTKKVQDRSK